MTSPGQKVYRLRDVENDVDDYNLTFKWANDELARQMSFNPEPISGGAHGLWFEERIEEGRWWILEEVGGSPIGQIRFDRRVIHLDPDGGPELSECFVVSIFVDEGFREQKFAYNLLRLGMERIDFEFPVGKFNRPPIVAYVKSTNFASTRLFNREFVRAAELEKEDDGYSAIFLTYVRF